MVDLTSIAEIAYMFKIPTRWLEDPYLFIFNLAIPFGLNAFAFYYILKKIVYKQGGIQCVILAGVFAFFALPIGQIATYFSPIVIVVAGMQSWSWRIIFLNIIYGTLLDIFPSIFAGKVPTPDHIFTIFLPTWVIGFFMIKSPYSFLITWRDRLIYLAVLLVFWIYFLPMLRTLY
jgi:hypothetical protein